MDAKRMEFERGSKLTDRVRHYLSHGREPLQMARAGHRRVTEGRRTCQDRARQILEAVERLRG